VSAVAEPKAPLTIRPVAKLFSERWTAILLFACSCLYLLAFLKVVNMEPDEGIVLAGAQRILDGQLPYRDFFSFYTPGSFYLTALLFKVFGSSIVVARGALVVFGASFAALTYVLARRACSQAIALLVGILVAMTAVPYRFLVLHNWDSTFWACLATYSAVRWLESSRGLWAFAAGAFASLTFLSEQSKGAGMYLGFVIALLTFAISGERISKVWTLVLGALCPLILTFTYFGSRHAIGPMFSAWVWPLRHYSIANRVPFGYQNWSDDAREMLFHTGSFGIRAAKFLAVSPGFVVPVMPLMAIGLLVCWTIQLRRRQNPLAAHRVLICSLISGLLVSVIVVRADIIHFMYLAPLFYLVLAWMLDAQGPNGGVINVIRPYVRAYVVVAFGLMGAALLVSALGAHVQVETRRGLIRSREKDVALEYTQNHTSAGEEILVYPYLPLYYYLTATRSSSRYDFFQPGMNTPEQAQEIIHSLQSDGVRTVLFESSFAEKIPNSWPDTPLSAIVKDPVADYIVRNFRVCSSLRSAAGWNFLYMSRKDLQCP